MPQSGAIRLFLWIVIAASASLHGSLAWAQAPFYLTQNLNLESYQAGDIVRTEPLPGAPDGASAFRILYRSTGMHGEASVVSGVVILPSGAAPVGGRPIVAWAHPTSGIEDQCAPSAARVFFQSAQGLNDMLSRGYIVAATDYPGLGTSGVHPYLVGTSEARSVIDIVRAARLVPGANAGQSFAVWGHSQGGQAALFTGILAKIYAPELSLVGVAAAAPATDLAALLNADRDTPGGRNITAMTLWSWSRVYGVPIESIVSSDAMPAVNRLAGECLERWFDIFPRRAPTKALARQFLINANFTAIEPWRGLLLANTPGTLPADIPIYLAQGENDNLVIPAITRGYRDKLCRAGSAVWLQIVPGVGHLLIAHDTANATVAWLGDRFAGRVPPDNCGQPS